MSDVAGPPSQQTAALQHTSTTENSNDYNSFINFANNNIQTTKTCLIGHKFLYADKLTNSIAL